MLALEGFLEKLEDLFGAWQLMIGAELAMCLLKTAVNRGSVSCGGIFGGWKMQQIVQ